MSQSEIERLRASASGVTWSQRVMAALGSWLATVSRWLRNRTLWTLLLFVMILSALAAGYWILIHNQP